MTYMQNVILLIALVLISSVGVTQEAPTFQLQGNNGPVNLDHYKGQVVYLDFWASWCTPCRKSFPWMNAIQKRYSAYGLKVIAVNLDKNRKHVQRFLAKVPADFTIAYDPAGTVAEAYRLQAMPSSFLIDRRGHITEVHKGFRNKDRQRLENTIRKLVASSE